MNIKYGKSIRGMRVASLVGVCVCVLGLAASNGSASLPNPHRDVNNDFASSIVAPSSADGEHTTATAAEFSAASDAKSKLNQEERFTNKTDRLEYRLRLENPADMVHLTVSAEVAHGLVRWELIDPTGATRSRIGTTERASMDTTNIQVIKGEWVLRMTLQDATGRYHICWEQ
ncbi:MAG TPA: hypothetical protein VIH97_13180 [Candidatus Acidoferrales bacterium]